MLFNRCLAFVAPLILAGAASASAQAGQTLHGRITATPSASHVVVQDDAGRTSDVLLHHGTVINPTGLTLRTGMPVTIVGSVGGNGFDADRVDVPIEYAYPYPPYSGFGGSVGSGNALLIPRFPPFRR